MNNYIRLGPVALRVSSKHLAPWGYPRLQIGGLWLWSWWSDGDFCPASYHPSSSITWLWQTKLHRNGWNPPHRFNSSGGRDIRLGFGWVLSILWQDRMPRDEAK